MSNYFHNSAGFYGLLLAPVVLFGLGLMYRQQKDRLEQNVSRARRTRAYGNAMKRWKDAVKSVKQKDDMFYGNLSKVLGGYLADVLNLPETAGDTEEALDALAQREIADDLFQDIRSIFDSADFVRFASGQDSTEGREELLRKAKTVILRLEKELKA